MKPQLLLAFDTFSQFDHTPAIGFVTAAAKYLDGDIDCLLIDPEIPRVLSPLANVLLDLPGMADQIRAQCRANATQIMDKLTKEAAAAQIRFRQKQVTSSSGSLPEVIAEEGHCSDLVICGIAEDPTTRALAETAIFESGRPTVVIPDKAVVPDFEHIAIAWDGSKVAAKAVSDAHFLISKAKKLTLVSVLDDKPVRSENSGERFAEYLNRKGHSADLNRIHGQGAQISKVLTDHVHSIGAGILVMGAFGHSRMRDFVLGGATVGILNDLRLPVLLSH